MSEIRSYIISIICTIAFFMVGSIMWYQLHLNYKSVNNTLNNLQEVQVYENIVLKDLKQVSDKEASKLESYRFVLSNNDTLSKKISIKLIDDYYNKYNSNYKIDNNYIKYMIKKDNGKYSNVRSLNMNGEIYFDNLDGNSECVYEIKLWVTDNYQDEFNYHGNLVIVYI